MNCVIDAQPRAFTAHARIWRKNGVRAAVVCPSPRAKKGTASVTFFREKRKPQPKLLTRLNARKRVKTRTLAPCFFAPFLGTWLNSIDDTLLQISCQGLSRIFFICASDWMFCRGPRLPRGRDRHPVCRDVARKSGIIATASGFLATARFLNECRFGRVRKKCRHFVDNAIAGIALAKKHTPALRCVMV